MKFNAVKVMFNLARDINSLSNFKRNTQVFVKQLKESGSPVVLTVNGVSELVVQSAESYQALLERLEYLEAVQGMQEGLEEFDQGQGQPAVEAWTALRSRLKDELKR